MKGFENRTRCKEALILVVIFTLIGSLSFLLVPLQFSFVLYFGLLIAVARWWITKKLFRKKKP